MNGETRVHEQQRRAAAPDSSVWVAASAGTGKTKVLVDRVLRLMLDGTPPQRILCLTFTRAAAAEMSNRINDRLGRWASAAEREVAEDIDRLTGTAADPAIVSKARRLFAEVLDAPGGMKIMTIHAFCESMLRRFPLESGIAPHFELMDERTAAETMHAARDALLERARHGRDETLAAALAEVTSWVHEDAFAELMTELARERGRLMRVAGTDADTAGHERRFRGLLGVGRDETAARVVAAACDEASFDGPGLRGAAEALRNGSKADRERGAAIANWLADPVSRDAGFDAYCGAYLTRKGEPRKTLITKAAAEAAPAAAGSLEREAARLVAVIERRNAATTATATSALVRLARGLLEAYEAHKTARAQLDYDDLILRARALLERDGGASWVLYKLDRGIDHVLIDEAQDTNPDQWAVVRALANEFFAGEGASERARTVFAVGDRKQSIFSFQRADPEGFARMNRHFEDRVRAAGLRWDTVDLDLSFRSTPAVLAAVDAVFADEDARDGLAEHGIRHVADRRGQAGLVELWPSVPPETRADVTPWTPSTVRPGIGRPSFRLAGVIAGRIRDWIERGEILESRARPVRPGDIMVLVRRRTPFVDELVSALKFLEVPVAGVDRMVLDGQLAIMDLVALGQFLLLPDDDLTLAVVLKGPLIGFDEDALFDLAYGRGERSLWRELGRRAAADETCAEAFALLGDLLARADFVPPYELYADILGSRGGRERIVARLGIEANDPLDEFLAHALAYEQVHPPSLQGFLQWFAEGHVEVKRDLEQSGRDEVRVMTVHGAKGLEAPIVFLADTMQTPDDRTRLLWTDGDGGPVLLWPPRRAVEDPLSRSLRAAVRHRAMQEYRRLLYVAMTRAEDRLYVCGYETRSTAPDECWYNMVARGLGDVAPTAERDFSAPGIEGWRGPVLTLTSPQAAAPDRAGPGAEPARVALLPDWARDPAPPEPAAPRPLAPSRPVDDEPAPRSPLDARLRRGLLIHRLLQTLPDLAPARRAEAARRFLARPAHGLAPEEQAEIAAETLAVLEAPRFAPLFAPGSRAEVPIIGRIGETIVEGRIDRLAVDGATVRLVDYKTNRSPPAREAEISPAYLRQLAAYRAVLAKVYPDSSISCALLWTDGPVLTEVGEATLAPYAP